MTKNALSQLVDRTARRDLVGRASSAQDRRVVMLSATPTGKVLAEAVYAAITERLPEIARNLDADDQRDFERVVTAVVDTSDLSAPTSNQPITP
ncbi:DNA-binding MarR family transcriptional regulator [Streptomyces sp. SAI-163]